MASKSLENGKREITGETVMKIQKLMKDNVLKTIGARSEEDGSESISIRCSNLNAAQTEELCMALHRCSSLNRMDLSETDIGKDGFQNVIRAVGHFSQSVKQLSFRGCHLDAEAGSVLFKKGTEMFPLPTVEELDLSHNNFDDAFAFQLAKALSSNSHLAILDLRNNHLSPKAQRALAEAAASHPSLKALPTETTWKDDRNVCVRACDVQSCKVM